MKLLFLIFTIVLVNACDGPSRNRALPEKGKTGLASTNVDTANIKDEEDKGGPEDTPIEEETTTNNNPGFDDCNLNYQTHTNNIGYFGICQNSINESQMKVKFQTADSNVGNCFVPMHQNNDGKSFHLYSRAECVYPEAGKKYIIPFQSSARIRNDSINAVMVLKFDAVNHFFLCMNAYSQQFQVALQQYYSSHINCQFSPSCQASANQWANQQANGYAQNVCTDFQAIYGDKSTLVTSDKL